MKHEIIAASFSYRLDDKDNFRLQPQRPQVRAQLRLSSCQLEAYFSALPKKEAESNRPRRRKLVGASQLAAVTTLNDRASREDAGKKTEGRAAEKMHERDYSSIRAG